MNERTIGRDGQACNRSKRKQPSTVAPPQVEGACPNGSLVESNILDQGKTNVALAEITWVMYLQISGGRRELTRIFFCILRLLRSYAARDHQHDHQATESPCPKRAHL